MIYGIRQSKIPANRALTLSDLTTLFLEIKDRWNGEIIKKALCDLKIGLDNIAYAVGDQGSDITKGLRLTGIQQFPLPTKSQ